MKLSPINLQIEYRDRSYTIEIGLDGESSYWFRPMNYPDRIYVPVERSFRNLHEYKNTRDMEVKKRLENEYAEMVFKMIYCEMIKYIITMQHEWNNGMQAI